MLLNEVQKQHKEIAALKGKVSALKEQNKELSALKEQVRELWPCLIGTKDHRHDFQKLETRFNK